jgi:ATP synthase protein I
MGDEIKKLEEKINKVKKASVEKNETESKTGFIYATKVGLRIGTEMLAGVLIGGGIGKYLDNVFETEPWLLVVFLIFGAVAGGLNIFRYVKTLNE